MRWLRYLVPYERFSLDSAETPAALAGRLRAQTSTGSAWSLSAPKEPYRGQVSEEGFRLQPVIRYRNSFLPVIIGRFEPTGGGARIDVRQRPVWFVLGFMTIWLAGVLLIGGAAVFASPESGDQGLWIFLGMLGFGVLLVNGGFWLEARKTRGALKEMLGAQERSHEVWA